MRFRRGAKLDTGQVTDLRGRRMGTPGGVAVGGGAVGLVGLAIYLLIALLGGGGGLGQLGPLDDQSVGRGDTPAEVSDQCADVEDINTRQDCRIIGDVNSIQSFWDGVFQRSNRKYEYVNTIFFDGQVQTGCGVADARVGPFYCPVDKLVYINLGFFDDLQSRFGVAATPFVEAYVIAHEYGHHVQDLLGVLSQISGSRQGPESLAVRSELQADCYAGVWAAHAVEAGTLEPLTQQDINSGLDAASAIGDDRIQARTQGQVNPETWTHGSSEQRRRWFSRGYEQGRPAACNTFEGSI
jgi:uncharacterized protein